MAQIVISHSKNDKDLVDFFSKAVKCTKVKAVFEEFERSHTGKITTHKTSQDVKTNFSVMQVNKDCKNRNESGNKARGGE